MTQPSAENVPHPSSLWASLRNEIAAVRARCARRFRSAVAFALGFKALNLILLAPLTAAFLRLCLHTWGRPSVGNFELLAFALSPVGMVALGGVGAVIVAALYLELTGLVRLLADDELPWWQALAGAPRRFGPLLRLGLRQLALGLVVAVPFLLGIGIAYGRYWRGKDINGLLILKPPEFWWGGGIALALAAAYAGLVLWLLLRQFYAAPILIFEPGTNPGTAMRESRERTRGRVPTITLYLAVWAAVQLTLAAAVLAAFQVLGGLILRRVPDSLTFAVLATGMILGAETLLAVLLGVFADVTFAAVWLVLYQRVAPPGALPKRSSGTPHRGTNAFMWRTSCALMAGALAVMTLSLLSLRGVQFPENMEITAHRAGATHAPENTLAALKQAVADGADWAEIDVQLTADKALVVLHDTDLARVGGGPRRVADAPLADLRALDLGAVFGQDFSGERIPTFPEMLAAADDHIRLNVELKPHGPGDAAELTRRTIDAIQQAGMVSRCRICSQSYESLQLSRQLEPRLPVGYIVGAGIGDATRLDVDFLMVKSQLATPQFVALARQRGRQVHAWTVNDPAAVAPLLDAGVANLITDDPARMRAQLEALRALSPPERLLLRAGRALRQ